MTYTGDSPNQPVSVAELRDVMGCYLTGVTIVTVAGINKIPYGLTVNSFNSVSLSPPLVLWSLDKRNDKLPLFRNSKGFAVNIMSAEQLALCQKFAAAENDRFADCDWCFGPFGQPVLAQSLASLECKPWAEYDGGDHTIFVGEVMSIKQAKGKAAAFYKGKLGHYEA